LALPKQKAFGLIGLTICFSIIDIHFENNTWVDWPPAPGFIKFIGRNIIWWFVGDTVKFGACDRLGNLKPLYAVPQTDTTT
jgi:hypothetical protein